MRIKRLSMYDTFDSKRELFLRALRHLEAEQLAAGDRRAGPTTTAAIMALAARVAVELASHDDEIGRVRSPARGGVASSWR